MKLSLTLALLLFAIISNTSAQITKDLLAAIPTLELNKDYTYKALKKNSDQMQKQVSLLDKRDKNKVYQVVGKIKLLGDWHLVTFSDYYKPQSEYIDDFVIRKYNTRKPEDYDKEGNWISMSLFVHKTDFNEIIRTLRFEKDKIVVTNQTESIKLTWQDDIKSYDGIGQEELLINVDKFPDLPLNEEIDIKKMVEIINQTKAETFCNIDGYCHFNVLGKVQGKKQLHIFLGYNYNLEDEYKDSYSYDVISLKGSDLKGWISPDNWYPWTESNLDNFKVTADKKNIIMKRREEVKKKPLR